MEQSTQPETALDPSPAQPRVVPARAHRRIDALRNASDPSSGPATIIMGEDPLAAVVWAANELTRYGMHFRAGEFVVSGSVCIPLPVVAGDTATISFTNLGSLEVSFID